MTQGCRLFPALAPLTHLPWYQAIFCLALSAEAAETPMNITADTADLVVAFVTAQGKKARPDSLTHVIWKYCDSHKIGLVSKETTMAVSFLLFFKKQF